MRCSECDMKRESVSDMLSRLSMLGSGEREAGLSGDDRDAILWAVDEIETAQKKSEEAEPSASDNKSSPKFPSWNNVCTKLNVPQFPDTIPLMNIRDKMRSVYDYISETIGR